MLFKLLQYINSLFFTNRTLTGKLRNPALFWDEVDRIKLLIIRLQDDDINWAIPCVYLRGLNKFNFTTELEAATRLYAAWIAISKEISDHPDSEVNSWWMYKLDAAGFRIIENLFPQLHPNDYMSLETGLPEIHKAVNNDIIYKVWAG